MLLFMIVFLVAIVASIVFLTRYFGPAQPMPPQAGGSDSPEVLLKRRYAGGEIDRDEYLQKLDDL